MSKAPKLWCFLGAVPLFCASCNVAEPCEQEVQLQGGHAGRALDNLYLEGKGVWSSASFESLPEALTIGPNFKPLVRKSASSPEDAEHIRRLWFPEFQIDLNGTDAQGKARIRLSFFYLSTSKLKPGDPIPVYDASPMLSVEANDLNAFARLRDDAKRWATARQPFALAHIESDLRKGDGPNATFEAGPRSYARSGQVVIEELWPRSWRRLDSFEGFSGTLVGTMFRVSASATLQLSDEQVELNARCLGPSE